MQAQILLYYYYMLVRLHITSGFIIKTIQPLQYTFRFPKSPKPQQSSFFSTTIMNEIGKIEDLSPDDGSCKIKIGIIGAGAAGLVAARVVSRTFEALVLHSNESSKGGSKYQLVVFEKESDIAGVWKYRTPTSSSGETQNNSSITLSTCTTTKKNRPMYRNLRTNLPKEVMAYREYPWSNILERVSENSTCDYYITETDTHTDKTNPSYVSHNDVYQYLQSYCTKYNLQQYIHHNCTVRHLRYVNNSTSSISPSRQCTSMIDTKGVRNYGDDDDFENEMWSQICLEWNEGDSTEMKSDTFDAVFICNGHYHVPSIPNNINGLYQYFHGTVIHSIEYDVPDAYIGQTVLCIGGRASGSDIAREIANMENTKVFLSDTAFPSSLNDNLVVEPITENNVTWIPKTIAILPDGRVKFASLANGVEVDPISVDVIILCTGYDYSFPFINEHSNLPQAVTCTNKCVLPLYEQLWYAPVPNIAFIGLPHSIIPFPLFELQVEAVVQTWLLQNRNATSYFVNKTKRYLKLPSRKTRSEKAMKDSKSGGYGKVNGRVPQDTHYLGSSQWDYCRKIAQYANLYNEDLEAYLITNKAIWDHSGFERKGDVVPGGPDLYRSTVYQRFSEGQSFRVVKTLLSTVL